VTLGRIAGHRGRSGELTVRVASGVAERWIALDEVDVASQDGEEVERYEVESSRAYRDRLVLKLRSIDNADGAARLRGRTVVAPREQVPDLPEGEHYRGRLVGLEVLEAGGRRLGFVKEIVETGAADLLQVETAAGGELLIPMVREMIQTIDERNGRVEVRLPDGLESLNPGSGEPA
jgi:16S rRNA processing protein RimM